MQTDAMGVPGHTLMAILNLLFYKKMIYIWKVNSMNFILQYTVRNPS